jgi:hypothetical protein
MKTKLRDKLTYANVMASVAVFIALSGSAYAALKIPRNSIGTRQLQAKSVTNGKLADGSVTGGKIAESTITGSNIDLPALGVVPQAAHATTAAEAVKLDKHEAFCPQDTTLIRGLCYDPQANSPAPNLEAAAEACAAKGGYLPTPMELYSTHNVLDLGTGGTAAQHEFTDDLYGASGSGTANKVVVVDGVSTPEEYEANKPSAYICVYPLVR